MILPRSRTQRERSARRYCVGTVGGCGSECEFCPCRGGGRIEALYQPYNGGLKEIAEINAEYTAPFVR